MSKADSYYLIGICGIGMSSLAQLIKVSGYNVRGSDYNSDPLIKSILTSKGITVYEGHNIGRLENTDTVVYSTAVAPDNPEYVEAKRRNLTLVHRTKALNNFLKEKKIIAVTGTHGKTTTTYMLAKVLKDSGVSSGMLIGGIPEDIGNNFIFDAHSYVVELDESDATFLDFDPDIKIITSIDSDHLEFYANDFSVLKSKFYEFLNKKGINLISFDDPVLKEVLRDAKEIINYGFDNGAFYRGQIDKIGEFGARFKVYKKDSLIAEVDFPLLGYKNALNSLSAFALGDIFGIDASEIALSLKGLKGIKRRYEVKFSLNEIKIIEDYAHHPKEINEVITTIKNYLKPKRLIVVFQPHRYTRTKYLWEEFKRCFEGADILFLTDIYSAFEDRIEGVNSFALAKEILSPKVFFQPLDRLCGELLKLIHRGDIILILGAGDICKISKLMVDKLKNGQEINNG